MSEALQLDLTSEYLGSSKLVNQIQPKVSICVQTYQHAAYISQCLDSILMQETSFPIEILIGEDDSSDGTREICQRYAERHPDKIRLFLHPRAANYNIAGKPTGKRNFLCSVYFARGEYIALCDGDDYWTSPHKLEKQYQALNESGYLIAFHSAYAYDVAADSSSLIAHYGDEQRVIAPGEIFPRFGSAMPMHSIMVSADLKPHILGYGFRVAAMHGFVQALGVCVGGGAVYLPEAMGVYRANVGTSIQKAIGGNGSATLEWAQRALTMLSIVDKISSRRQEAITSEARQYLVFGAVGSGNLCMSKALKLVKTSGVAWLNAAALKGWVLFVLRRPRKALATAKTATASESTT